MKKRIVYVLMIILLMSQIQVFTCKASETNVQKKETSVLQVVVFYTDSEGNVHSIQGGAGFIIGDEESGAQYMITAKEVTSVPKETEEELTKLYVKDSEREKLAYTTKVVIKRDVMLDVQLVAESNEMGFAVWKLSQPIYDREALVLSDKSLTGVSGQQATVLGFPTAPTLTGETIYYAMDEMISKDGMLIGDGKEENIAYLYHNITPNAGMIGGPIINGDGHVIAINQSKEAQQGYYALQMTEVLSVLEALGVPYLTTSEVEARIQAELAAIVHKEALQSGIALAESLDGKLYYKDTYALVTSALEEATLVNENEKATQEEVNAALEKLNNAVLGLKENPPVWVIALIVISVIIVITGISYFIWKKTKPKRELKKQQKIEEFTVTQASPVFTENKAVKEDYKTIVSANSQEINRGYFEPQRMDEVYGETTIIQQESESSTELLMDGKKSYGYLVRKRTGERITITAEEFVMGKDPSQTDYCITGNSAISRAHAVIICKGSAVDISDKNATNGTFVNGVKVAAFQKVSIKDGDIIRLADDEFEYSVHS